MRRSLIQRKLGRVDRALEKAIANNEIPGVVVLACMPREGEELEHVSVRGHARLRPERMPMTRETVFDLASLTKPMATATALLLLVDEGRVELDAPVAKFLPAFGERGKENVTVRQLLTHSSGLKPWRPFHEALLERERKRGETWLRTPAAREAVLERIFRSALVHDPGTAAVYGDLDFIVLGALVEEVAGSPLDVYCQEHIFTPLGLTHTRFIRLQAGEAGAQPASEARSEARPSEDSRRRRVEGPAAERSPSVESLPPPQSTAAPSPPSEVTRLAATENCPWRGRILCGEVHDPNAWAMGGVAGHAGLFAPADDVLRFARIVLDVWHGRSDALPPDTLRTFLARQELPPGSDWALGWDTPSPGASSSGRLFSKQSVGHLGFTGTSLWIDLEREAVVVMLTNRVHLVAKKSPFRLRPRVHDLILEAFQAE